MRFLSRGDTYAPFPSMTQLFTSHLRWLVRFDMDRRARLVLGSTSTALYDHAPGMNGNGRPFMTTKVDWPGKG